MMKYLSIIFVLSVCGCSSGTSSNSVSNTQDGAVLQNFDGITETINDKQLHTAEIVADESFSFNIEQEITLEIIASEEDAGTAHIYGESDPQSPTDNKQPDYLSRITSITPRINPKAVFSYSGIEGELWVQWVPTNASSEEKIVVVKIFKNKKQYIVVL